MDTSAAENIIRAMSFHEHRDPKENMIMGIRTEYLKLTDETLENLQAALSALVPPIGYSVERKPGHMAVIISQKTSMQRLGDMGVEVAKTALDALPPEPVKERAAANCRALQRGMPFTDGTGRG